MLGLAGCGVVAGAVGVAPHFGGVSGQDSVAIAILLVSPSGALFSEHPHNPQVGFFVLEKYTQDLQILKILSISSWLRSGEPAAFQFATAIE